MYHEVSYHIEKGRYIYKDMESSPIFLLFSLKPWLNIVISVNIISLTFLIRKIAINFRISLIFILYSFSHYLLNLISIHIPKSFQIKILKFVFPFYSFFLYKYWVTKFFQTPFVSLVSCTRSLLSYIWTITAGS